MMVLSTTNENILCITLKFEKSLIKTQQYEYAGKTYDGM